jgi:hypothetical protein
VRNLFLISPAFWGIVISAVKEEYGHKTGEDAIEDIECRQCIGIDKHGGMEIYDKENKQSFDHILYDGAFIYRSIHATSSLNIKF